MKDKSKDQKGSILLLAIIILLVGTILGIGLLTITSNSHKQAIYIADEQQAYYAAKEVIDTFIDDLLSKTNSEQKMMLDTLFPTGTTEVMSNECTIIDDNVERPQEWRCKLTIKKVVSSVNPNITDYHLTANATSHSNSNIEGKIKAVIRTDSTNLSATSSNTVLSMLSNFPINTNHSVYMDRVFTSGFMGWTAKEDIKINQLVSSQGLTFKTTQGKIELGEISAKQAIQLTSATDIMIDKLASTYQGIDLNAANNIRVNKLRAPGNIEVKSGGSFEGENVGSKSEQSLKGGYVYETFSNNVTIEAKESIKVNQIIGGLVILKCPKGDIQAKNSGKIQVTAMNLTIEIEADSEAEAILKRDQIINSIDQENSIINPSASGIAKEVALGMAQTYTNQCTIKYKLGTNEIKSFPVIEWVTVKTKSAPANKLPEVIVEPSATTQLSGTPIKRSIGQAYCNVYISRFDSKKCQMTEEDRAKERSAAGAVNDDEALCVQWKDWSNKCYEIHIFPNTPYQLTNNGGHLYFGRNIDGNDVGISYIPTAVSALPESTQEERAIKREEEEKYRKTFELHFHAPMCPDIHNCSGKVKYDGIECSQRAGTMEFIKNNYISYIGDYATTSPIQISADSKELQFGTSVDKKFAEFVKYEE